MMPASKLQTISSAVPMSPVEQPPGGPVAGAASEPIFSAAEIEQLGYRRFNPLAALTADSLSRALDAFNTGDLRPLSRLWEEIARRDSTIATVMGKRAEAVALRDWTVTALDDSPEAEDQAAALTFFYQHLHAGHALNRHARGGFPLLCMQMMDAVPCMFAVHHLIWKPDPAATFTLPSGRTVPGLSLLAEQVPLEYFESRTGALRFLGIDNGYTGEPLAENDWMISVGPGLMFAACIEHYFKRLAKFDLVNFSEKFGTPGMVVHTTAAIGTTEAAAAAAFARSMGSNYRGVQYGAMENKVEVIWPEGGTSGGNLPMIGIIEECKRDITVLFLGADLSTMSRGGAAKGVGASLQADEQEKRERADCARISETLQAQIDPVVIRWFFGDDAPVLAKFVLESPINEDRALLGSLVQQLVNLGAKVPIVETARRLQVSLAKDGDEVFIKPVALTTPAPDNGIALNSTPSGIAAAAKLQTAAASGFAKAKRADLAPILDRLAAIGKTQNPVIQRAALRKFFADVPAVLGQTNADPATAHVLADAMSAALFNGTTETAVETHGNPSA